MLTSASVVGALVKESNIVIFCIKSCVVNALKAKKVPFWPKISSFSFLNRCPGHWLA